MAIGRDSVSGRALLDKKSVHVEDLSIAGDEFAAGREMALRLGHRTTLSTPLLRDEEAIGVLVIRRLEVRPFNRKQIELLSDLRRPGGDCDRERSPVPGGSSAHSRLGALGRRA